MELFDVEDFINIYNEYSCNDVPTWKIKASCEMIFSQIGLRYRDTWTKKSVPLPIKEACMEQLRFMLEHDIPFVDYKEGLKSGSMEAKLNSDYSTLALRILANHGYLFRGSRINDNMGIVLPFGN